MGMFNQQGGSGGRAQAQANSAPGNFPAEVPYDYDQGVPKSAAGGVYKDGANTEDAKNLGGAPVGGIKPTAIDAYSPQPFSNIRDK